MGESSLELFSNDDYTTENELADCPSGSHDVDGGKRKNPRYLVAVYQRLKESGELHLS